MLDPPEGIPVALPPGVCSCPYVLGWWPRNMYVHLLFLSVPLLPLFINFPTSRRSEIFSLNVEKKHCRVIASFPPSSQ